MKDYAPKDIRNFAIVGHASSGKTTLSEAMLACAGVINRMGSIAAGTTVSDYHDSEKNRRISTHASLLHAEWLGRKLNVIDCPGYSDFIAEGLGALRVGDFALVVVHAAHGVGVGTDAVWKYATQFGLPKFIVINALDKENTNFDGVLEQLREHYGPRVFPLNLPLNPGPGFNQMIQKQSFIPLFCTSAEQNIGILRLLDVIAKYGSSPEDRAKVPAHDANGKEIQIGLNDPEPVLYVWKTMAEAQFGELSFFRLYSGSVQFGSELFNSDRRSTEKIGQIYILNGRNREAVPKLGAGDIGAVVKLKGTNTGDTLSSPARVATLPRVVYPKPTIHSALRLKVKGEEDKVAQGLTALQHEDPTFHFHVDGELHQTVLSAQGELHLDVLVERLKRRFKVDVDLTAPRIPFRETIRAKADSKYRHKKQTGGAGQFAEVWMRIEPTPRNSGLDFTQSLSGQNVDRVFVPSVEKGVNSACKEGILAGYRIVDVMVDFYDGKMHAVDSNDISFQLAGKEAFREAFQNAKPCLLEPIHKLEITVPEDALGKIIGDLSSRRGRIVGMDADGSFQVVKATAPAMELHHYGTVLRSLTGGRGIHKEEFSHYEEMPREMEAKIVEEAKKARQHV
ncbi:MAG: elongation factor G [Verrucomicrobia bacterium]|nr:elongation factor G [Verrucomicrobiota bacterium]